MSGQGEAPLEGEGMDQDLYGGGDRYAGYARSIPLEGDEEEEQEAPMVGGPRCVCVCVGVRVCVSASLAGESNLWCLVWACCRATALARTRRGDTLLRRRRRFVARARALTPNPTHKRTTHT